MTPLILGTAGHIDHGKSTLIKCLTGTDPDRLAEEKRRGITIELGFAELTLPSGQRLGVVDVPGHEKFVRHMVAGAVGIDIALLVIAADDGIMVQTLEHLAILRLLGVRHLVVAVSKADAVDADTLELALLEITELLDSTEYAGAPLIAVSGISGQGTQELLAALDAVAACVSTRATSDLARLPIDRVFTIAGAGTVVTGTLWEGRVMLGDTLELLPHKHLLRVRGIQVHGKSTEVAHAGQRAALNLANIAVSDIARGDVLASPGSLKVAQRLSVELSLLSSEPKPLRSGTLLHVHHASREVMGRVLLGSLRELAPGTTAPARLRLSEALVPACGDRFILRGFAPLRTIGGGVITALYEPPVARVPALKEASAEEVAAQQARQQQAAELEVAVTAVLPKGTLLAKSANEIAHEVGADESLVRQVLGLLLARGSIVRLSGTLHFAPEAIELARQLVCDALTQASEGLGAAALRDVLGTGRKTAIALLEYFDTQGLTRREGVVRVLRQK